MPYQSVRKYCRTRVKVTRLALRTTTSRLQSAAEPATLNYRRPLKTGNIVQTWVNALMAPSGLRTSCCTASGPAVFFGLTGQPGSKTAENAQPLGIFGRFGVHNLIFVAMQR